MKLSKNGHKASGGDHPDHQVVCMMPQPPRIFGHIPVTRAYNCFIYLHYITTAVHKCRAYAALTPRHLRVPPPPTPCMHIDRHLPWRPQLTQGQTSLAHAGSNVLGSSHQLWHHNPTVGHQR